jgi:photosystem II stability/assembly factor-like uncharacterized protein
MITLVLAWWILWRPRWQPFGPTADTALLTVSPTFAADRLLFAVSDADEVYRSSDGGTSWDLIPGLRSLGDSIVFSANYAADRTIVTATGQWPIALALSRDAGATWTPLPAIAAGESAMIIALYGDPEPTLFVSTYTSNKVAPERRPSLYRWTELGGAWERLRLPATAISPDTIILSPDYAADHTLFLDDWPAYRSTDSGASWTEIAAALSEQVVFSPDYTHDRTIFAVGVESLMRSSDAGATWTSLPVDVWGCNTPLQLAPGYPADPTLLIATSAQYHGEKYAQLHWSHDGGTTWRHERLEEFAHSLFGGPGGCLEELALSPAYPADPTLLLMVDDEVQLSRNAGASWTSYGQDSLFFWKVYLPAYFSAGGRVFGAGSQGVNAIRLPR